MSELVPILLFALAALVLAVGLPFSRRFLRRGRYIAGLVLVALSLSIFWPDQMVYSQWVETWSVYGILAILPLLLSLFLFSGGIGLISKANNTPRDDHYDSLLP